MTDTKTGTDLAKQVLAKGAASRRGVMCGLAGLGAAGALAACGTAESPSSSSSSSDAPADTSADGATSEGTEGGATGEAIAATTDVPEGSGLVVDEIVIVQPTADEFAAFSAVCPHQGAIVSAPDADGNIICPRHQSTWTIDGALEQGPAETDLPAVEITVEDGQIFLA
jgi:Rieske Fe-S protein